MHGATGGRHPPRRSPRVHTHTHIYVYIYPERRTAMHVPQVLGLRAREKLVSVANFKPRGTAFLELNYAGEACGKIRKPTR